MNRLQVGLGAALLSLLALGPLAEAEEEDLRRENPHHPAEPYDVEDPTCSACHFMPPERGAAPEQARLRLPLDRVCTTCHPGAVHVGATQHVDQQVSPEVREGLPPEVAVDAKGTVHCWSCHDVHEGGAAEHPRLNPFSQALAAHARRSPGADPLAEAGWPEPAATEHPPLLALPLAGGALCRACHGGGP